MTHNYHALVANQIFMGAAADMQDLATTENVSVIVDLRAESTGCAATQPGIKWIKVPLGDNSPTEESILFKQAIDEVVAAYRSGEKVAFHCGMGRGRTGTVAAGVLLELGLAANFDEAESRAKEIRPQLSIQPVQAEALRKIYGS